MPEQPIKTIIADADKTASAYLKQLLNTYFKEFNIVAVCTTIQNTMNSIQEFNPTLIFSETELPDGSLFDMLRNLPERSFKVIFITSGSDQAIKAFRFSATDYLIKPVKRAELETSISKLKTELAESDSYAGIQKNYLEFLNKTDETKTLVVSNTKGFNVLKTDDIIFLEADGYCTNFYLSGKIKISSARNLKYYSGLLPYSNFMRVHHSYIINLDHVKGYNSDEEIMLSEKLSCSLSAANKSTFIRYFKQSSANSDGNHSTKI